MTLRQILRDVLTSARLVDVDRIIADAVAAGIFTDAVLDVERSPADSRDLANRFMVGTARALAATGLDDIADVFPITPITKEEARDLKTLDD